MTTSTAPSFLTPEQQAIRLNHIGASEVAAVLGLDPWKGPREVWERKIGIAEESPQSESAEWGNRLEAAVLAKYCEKNGLTLINPAEFAEDFHPAISCLEKILTRAGSMLSCTPDAIAADNQKFVRAANAKTADRFSRPHWGEDGSDDVPDYYYLQGQAELFVTGLEVIDFPVLFGGNRYQQFTVQRDGGLLAEIVPRLEAWWGVHVAPAREWIEKNPPPPSEERLKYSNALGVFVDEWLEALSQFAPLVPKEVVTRDNKRLIEAAPDIAKWCEDVTRWKREIDAAQVQVAHARDLLEKETGNAYGLKWPGGKIIFPVIRPKPKTDWEAVARDLGASEEQIAKHTTPADAFTQMRVYAKGE